MLWKDDGETLPDYLDNKVFAGAKSIEIMAEKEDIIGFSNFIEKYKASFSVEKEAVRTLR
jgi:hypothetical protein